MRVAIIGAGFGGLAASYRLARSGVDVTVFESDNNPGGLAIGFKEPKWKWSIEKHYHHWFTSDWAVRNLAQEINQKVIFKRPKTSTFIDGESYQLDSATSLLLFDKIPFLDRVRLGLVLAYLKLTPNWKALESLTAESFLKRFTGVNVWEVLWKPLFEKKFSDFSDQIPASWFWARIKKRSASLGYPEGGFLGFAELLDKEIEKKGGRIFYSTRVEKIFEKGRKLFLKTQKYLFDFDRVVCTLPSSLFVKMIKDLPESYIENLLNL